MYHFALVKMLHNTKQNTFHPIYYLDKPFPGPIEEQSILRYKSNGHHTKGFGTREEAVLHANNLEVALMESGDTVTMEIEESDDMLWDGEDLPLDTQLRPFPKTTI